MRFHVVLLAVVAAVLVWSGIRPHDYFTWLLEVFPVLLAIPVLGKTYRRFRLTGITYSWIAVHAVILMVGGHYTYAEVPLGNWVRDALDLSRNHYDRVGHFVQGFIPAIIAREVFLRNEVVIRKSWLFFIVVCVCLAISASYELIEWSVAVMTGEAADAFLGTQGDVWDTQTDMALALVGSFLGQLFFGKWQDRQIAKITASHQVADSSGRLS